MLHWNRHYYDRCIIYMLHACVDFYARWASILLRQLADYRGKKMHLSKKENLEQGSCHFLLSPHIIVVCPYSKDMRTVDQRGSSSKVELTRTYGGETLPSDRLTVQF